MLAFVTQKLPERLNTWKEIAGYLGVSTRTAQKWEKQRGLPVQRMEGERGRVRAETAEISKWLEQISFRDAHRNSRSAIPKVWVGLASTALLAAFVVLAVRWMEESPTPYEHIVDSRSLIVRDRSGWVVGRHSFDDPMLVTAYQPSVRHQRVWSGDLNGDGRTETLFTYYPETLETKGTKLYLFDDGVDQLWEFAPGEVISAGERTFSSAYFIENFLLRDLDNDGLQEILLSSHHFYDYPNQFVILEGLTGDMLGSYWHSGFLPYLDTMDLDGDDVDEILLGGVNNGRRAATLVVLDAGHVSGASRQPEGDSHQLRIEPLDTEKAVVFFSQTCINELKEVHNYVAGVRSLGNRIEVHVAEKGPGHEVIYTLGTDLKVKDVNISVPLRNLHKELESAGELDHSLSPDEINALKEITIHTP